MKERIGTSHMIISWIVGIAFFAIGVLNIVLIHPVPGIVYILLSFIYFPFANTFTRKNFGFKIPVAVKIILAIVIIWFTLGISDLGDMFV